MCGTNSQRFKGEMLNTLMKLSFRLLENTLISLCNPVVFLANLYSNFPKERFDENLFPLPMMEDHCSVGKDRWKVTHTKQNYFAFPIFLLKQRTQGICAHKRGYIVQ